ncbi:MAG TPA: glycosyltransferase family A protein [Mycobacteriales bacterium]|nr:glycosyltransferase family A protein [Mycobacteriales bacterium]
MRTAPIRDQARSPSWPDADACASVVVATHDRSAFLPELLDALAAQTVPVEVIVADDGSTDDTWQVLGCRAADSELPLLALRLPASGGPSVPRNSAAAYARTEVLVLTDDDCLPDPGWAAALLAGLGDRAIGQGRTVPAGARTGPWDRTIEVTAPSGLFETCNLALRRDVFVELDGFPILDLLPDQARGFGEDVVLGTRAARRGGLAWVPDALVRHRWLPTTYAEHLDGVRRLSGFPWLARELPEVAELLVGGLFLSRRTAVFDAAAASLLAAAATRRPWLAVGAAPWLVDRLGSARGRPGRSVAVRLAQEAVADAVGLGSLVRGSLRHRRPVL